jgi:hypothetical protein
MTCRAHREGQPDPCDLKCKHPGQCNDLDRRILREMPQIIGHLRQCADAGDVQARFILDRMWGTR